MSGKRSLQNGAEDSDAKRIRSNNGSPAPAPATTNGAATAERSASDVKDRMAAIKARLAANKTNGTTSTAPALPTAPAATAAPARSSSPPASAAVSQISDTPTAKMSVAQQIAEAKARAAAARARLQGTHHASTEAGASSPTPPPSSGREARMAEVRARAEQHRIAASAVPTPPPRQDERTARGGLGVGLHPSLMGDLSAPATGKGRNALSGPKFSTTKGNQQPERPALNPYLSTAEDGEKKESHGADSGYDTNVVARKGGERKSKALVFNEKGKFMAQANALRQQARLEDMKKRIALETRKVQIEEASDKSFLVPAPPNIEWWDEGLLPESQNSYDDCLEEGRNKIDTNDSIITRLIQRPVLLQAPQDKFIPAPKPLMLTKVEQKKLRRQGRMAIMKEEQAKIRHGLVDPPPPKVKKSNMMTVLGEQAVKDPTAVEARVNREIAQRQYDHERANEDRKLTKEQRAEKLKMQQAGDDAKGIKVAIFRVDNFSSGKHRYQVDINAKQNALTGIVVLHPTMNLVIVEGGAHSIGNYKKLMLNRIKWAENTLPLSSTNPTTFTQPAPPGSAAAVEGGANKASQWCNPLNDNGELKDLSDNRCLLVWEGDEQARAFRKWGSKAVETDGEARDVLSRQKMENMWSLARSK